ncbi:MAG: glycosyltransferase [Treponema sp.]|nr:glycosyltransferase [Treponema sp.]
MEYATELALKIYLWFCIAALAVYLPRIIYYFIPFIKQKRLINPKKNKIAVIIPARNESTVISHCLNSLTAQTYDPQYFDMHIVIADEADPTMEIAAAYERAYVTIVSEQTSKGEALDGVLKKILTETPDKYDAFLIVDADNLAAPDLLEEMNNALSSGKQIICGKKLVKNWENRRRDSRSFISNCTALTWTQLDELGNRGRNVFGISITIIGTGLMVRADVIKENNGWPYRSLTEDYEMTADAILKGWTSMYYSHAKVYTEEATDAKTAFKRKMRWIKGYTQCQRQYRKKIVKQIFSSGIRWRSFDFLYGAYPLGAFFVVSAIAIIFGITAVGFSLFGNAVSLAEALRMALIPFSFIYASLFVFTLLTLIVDWHYIKIPLREKLALQFFNPIYTLEYYPIAITAFTTSYDYFKWENTDRIPFEAMQTACLADHYTKHQAR